MLQIKLAQMLYLLTYLLKNDEVCESVSVLGQQTACEKAASQSTEPSADDWCVRCSTAMNKATIDRCSITRALAVRIDCSMNMRLQSDKYHLEIASKLFTERR